MKTDAMAVSLGPIGALYVTTDPPARNPNTCVTTSASNHYMLNTAQVNNMAMLAMLQLAMLAMVTMVEVPIKCC